MLYITGEGVSLYTPPTQLNYDRYKKSLTIHKSHHCPIQELTTDFFPLGLQQTFNFLIYG
jgi:hypothetical protein